jgi:indoleacetamide hydrolase
MNIKQIARIVSIVAAAAISPPLQAQGNLTELSAAEAAKLIRAGKLKSEDLVKALCDQIENKKELGAFISYDREAALKAARAADADAAKGKFKGALHGVPLVVKDNIHVAGFPNTAGTLALKDFRPKSHAPIVAKLIGAGAIVLGKNNMHELAFGITNNNGAFGPARNPYDRKRIPGGSSGGTGVAIAARMAAAGLGSDTGGSVRIPRR